MQVRELRELEATRRRAEQAEAENERLQGASDDFTDLLSPESMMAIAKAVGTAAEKLAGGGDEKGALFPSVARVDMTDQQLGVVGKVERIWQVGPELLDQVLDSKPEPDPEPESPGPSPRARARAREPEPEP